MREYEWHSPGGLYVVPDDFRARFLSEFPDYRIRWSLQSSMWHIEQRVGRSVVAPLRIDEGSDALIRAADGMHLVMTTAPGDRMACPTVITRLPFQRCNGIIQVPTRRWKEVRCPWCALKGRDGRVACAYFPFDETLLDHLRRTNPLNRGVVKVGGKVQTQAAADADAANRRMLADAAALQADASSLDYVDLRWLGNVPTAGQTRRLVDDTTFR